MYEYEAIDQCPYQDECLNANNSVRCGYCEKNPFNYEIIERFECNSLTEKRSKGFYRFRDNYSPV